MNKRYIIEYLRDNGVEGIEDIECTEDTIVLKVCYYYDEVELEAARSYALEESDEDEDEWREEYYIPYLMDIAEDNVSEIVEEICEELDIIGQYASIRVDQDEDFNEFIVAFSEEEFDIEDMIEQL